MVEELFEMYESNLCSQGHQVHDDQIIDTTLASVKSYKFQLRVINATSALMLTMASSAIML